MILLIGIVMWVGFLVLAWCLCIVSDRADRASGHK